MSVHKGGDAEQAEPEREPEAIELDENWSTFDSAWIAAALGIPKALLRVYASPSSPEMIAVSAVAFADDGRTPAYGLACGYLGGREGVARAYLKTLISIACGLSGEAIAWPHPSTERAGRAEQFS